MVVQTNRPLGRVVAMGVTAAMACASLVAAPIVAQAQSKTQANQQKDVQVIAFQQTWNTIAKECTNTYGPEGVAYVEVSPPQESIQGTQWWTSYQPVSYKLDSKLGTEAEFKNMVQQCSAAGVGIIADVVLNQTTGADVAAGDQKGVAGSEYNGSTGSYPGFATKQYPDGITAADFHSCTKNISDYTNQKEVQECRLSSMWDFNSESEKVQDIQSDYLASLWNAGVRGFRMDAVKHIHTDSVKAIKEKFAKKIGKNANDIYWIQEVIGNASEAAGIQPSNYVQNGTVTEFGFKSEMNQTFKDKIANLKGLSDRLSKDLSSDDANVFVTQLGHRPQRGCADLQGRRQVPAGQRVHAGLRLRHPAPALRLQVGRQRQRCTRSDRDLRARRGYGQGMLHQRFRLELRAALDLHPRHDRLPQLCQRHQGRRLAG